MFYYNGHIRKTICNNFDWFNSQLTHSYVSQSLKYTLHRSCTDLHIYNTYTYNKYLNNIVDGVYFNTNILTDYFSCQYYIDVTNLIWYIITLGILCPDKIKNKNLTTRQTIWCFFFYLYKRISSLFNLFIFEFKFFIRNILY